MTYGSRPEPSGTSEQDDCVMMIVDALRSKFGDNALAVSRAQFETASEQSRISWAMIVGHLSV